MHACEGSFKFIILRIMNTNTLAWKLLISGAGLAIVGGCGGPQRTPGKAAPGFELNDLSGSKVSLADQKGHVVLLSFWAVG